jgi:hypothetical protein
VNLRQAGPRQLVHGRAHIKVGIAGQLAAMLRLRQRRIRNPVSDIENPDSAFDLNIALVDTPLVKVIQRKRLLQGEYVLGLVVAHRSGSRSPATIARTIRIPVTPVISVITWCNWIFMKVSAFCMCWICAAA